MDDQMKNGRNGEKPYLYAREIYVFLHMLTKVGFQEFRVSWYYEDEGDASSFSGIKYCRGEFVLTAEELEKYSSLDTVSNEGLDSISVFATKDGVNYFISGGYSDGIRFCIFEDFVSRGTPVSGELLELQEQFYDMVWEWRKSKR